MSNTPTRRHIPRPLLLGVIILLLPLSYLLGGALGSGATSKARTEPVQEASLGAGAALVNPPHRVQDFSMTNHQGDPLQLRDLRGRAVLLFFGYTHCPDECPATLANFQRVERALGSEADKVAFVFISVDPQRDSPTVIRDYLAHFSEDFIGLVGEPAVLDQIAGDYMLAFESEGVQIDLEHEHADSGSADHDHGTHDHGDSSAEDAYLIQHTSPAFLLDSQGYLRMLFFANTEYGVIEEGVRQVLALPPVADSPADAADAPSPQPTEAAQETAEAAPEPTEIAVETAEAAPETAEAAPAGDPTNGEQLFKTLQPEVGTMCSTCHLADSDDRLVGPGLLTIGARAGERVPGQDAATYLREAILNPGGYVVEDYADIMPKNWGSAFSEAELADLLAYLLSLNGEN